MSMMKTLAKVALGVAVAKGISGMANRGSAPGTPGQQPGGLGGGMGAQRGGGGLLGSLGGALGGGAAGGGLGGALGQVLGGRGGSGAGGLGGALGSGGLGGLLGSLGGAAQQPGGIGGAARGGGLGSGGLDGLLGGLLGGAAAGAGGGLLGKIAGQAQRPQGEPEADFGTVLNSQFDDERPDMSATPEQEAAAGLMLRAMIQAAKADGQIDDNEREKLLGHLRDATAEEQQFVQEEMRAPVDPEGLARQVPRGLEPQVYAMSLMAIDLDSRAEAEHLHRLATAMNLPREQVDGIHEQMGVPPLYRS